MGMLFYKKHSATWQITHFLKAYLWTAGKTQHVAEATEAKHVAEATLSAVDIIVQMDTNENWTENILSNFARKFVI